ncbi:MAG: hypothetical protein ACRDNE_03720 [Gaiellaceae bacterium]
MSPATFDPYAVFHELDRARATYIVIGALARVLQGSDEVTQGFDLTPSLRPQNLERLGRALESLEALRVDGKPLDVSHLDPAREPVVELTSPAGEIKIVPEPVGTRGYDDLRRRRMRLPLGEGLRPDVASPGDLVRMLESLGREQDISTVAMMRRVVELDRGLELGL